MNYLNLNIGLRALISACIPHGGVLSSINVLQIHNTVFKYVNRYVLAQEE